METMITNISKAANPGAGDVYVAELLPNIAISYFQTAGGLHDIFPSVPVELQTGYFAAFSRADTLRVQTVQRAPGAPTAQVGFNTDLTGTYSAKVFDAEYAPPAEVVANYRLPGTLDSFATRLLARAAYLRRELTWTTNFFTSGVWGTTTTPSVLWDDPSSDPIGDIETGIETVLLATGYKPNVMALGYQAWKELKQLPDIIARIGTGSASNFDPRMVTEKLVAALFGLEEIRVGSLVYNSAAAGASISTSFTAGKNALLCFRTSSPSILEPSAGYKFAWTGLASSLDGIQMRRGYEARQNQNWYQILHAEDFKKTAAELGYFFSGAVS